MTAWNWNGSRWWKFDFHTHTPVSDDYGKGPDQAALRARSPREWLLDFMRAELDCIAVTDHNSGGWVDKLKEALEELRRDRPEGYRDLSLFPGVEISVYGGIHVLALFDCSVGTAHIDTLLGAVGFEGTKGQSDAVTTKAFSDVAAAIIKAGGIAIPAHVDENKGLLSSFEGTTLKQAIECIDVVGMELIELPWPKPTLYTDSRVAWVEVLGSDSHHPTNTGPRYPGSHFTWVKMARPSLEGLRLALLDGSLSVSRSDSQQNDPNVHASLMIESLTISHARYMGRSRPFSLVLNPWLNCVIGGRGTGKSTLVEFLRATLRREGELPRSLSSDFEKYRRTYANRNDEGLLTAQTYFSVVYRKDAARYRINWATGDTATPIEVDDGNGGWKPEKGDVVQRFPIRIYSQKQVFELAKDPLSLLKIIDEAGAVDRQSWDLHWREEFNRFLSLRAEARRVEAGLVDEPRLLGELEDVKRKLEAFEGTDHSAILKEYQHRKRQMEALENWESTWSTVGDKLKETAEWIAPPQLQPDMFEGANEADADLLARTASLIEGLGRIKNKVEELAGECAGLHSTWTSMIQTAPWKLKVDSALQAYEDLCHRLKVEGAGDPAAYGELVKRRQDIELRLAELKKRRKELDGLLDRSSVCMQSLLSIRQNLTERRKDFIASVLAGNPYVRIAVIPYGARETIEPEIRRLIQRENGFEKDIGTPDGGDTLLGRLYDGSPDQVTLEQRFGSLKRTIRLIASGQHSPADLKDQRFGTHLAKLPPEAMDYLEAWYPEDTLHVEYSTGGDGAAFRSIQEGSPGQKTAALLAFLLSYGEEPIVLDQPEDDLDNHLIYNLIVQQLRAIKRRRQVLVITHNANIVVNGDAELVAALATRGGESQHEAEGSLQDKTVRDTICTVMEGGREAFEQRYRRISPEGRAAPRRRAAAPVAV